MNSIILIAVCLTNPPLRDVLYISATHKQLYRILILLYSFRLFTLFRLIDFILFAPLRQNI